MPVGEEIVVRETTEVYTTSDERAAYRAGMSTAFMICDELARDCKTAHTVRGRVTKSGLYLAAMARSCGDAIERARKLVVPD